MVKIAIAKNLVNSFTTTLTIRVFDGHRGSIVVTCIPNRL